MKFTMGGWNKLSLSLLFSLLINLSAYCGASPPYWVETRYIASLYIASMYIVETYRGDISWRREISRLYDVLSQTNGK